MYEPMPLSAEASSSAPITTISPIEAEMRMPVKMNGAALGRLMRRRIARVLQAKAARGLHRDRIDVVNAVDGVEQDRPRRCIGHQDDLHRETLAPQQNAERDQSDRGDRPHEFDHRRTHFVGQLGGSDENADRHADQRREREPDRPGIERCQDLLEKFRILTAARPCARRPSRRAAGRSAEQVQGW